MRTKCILLIVLLLVLIPCHVSAASTFADVPEDAWYAPYVQEALENDIITGYPGGLFKPTEPVLYSEFLVMAMRGRVSDNVSSDSYWSDKYYYGGIERGFFTEEQIPITMLWERKPIPRKYMAVIMAGIIKANGISYDNSITPSDLDKSDPCYQAVCVCLGQGCLAGYGDGLVRSFKPDGILTRAEAATAALALAKAENAFAIPEGRIPEPTDRESLLYYMNNFQEGIDVGYNNGSIVKKRSVPYFFKYFDSDEESAKAFFNTEVWNYAQRIIKSIKFRISGGYLHATGSYLNEWTSTERGYIDIIASSRNPNLVYTQEKQHWSTWWDSSPAEVDFSKLPWSEVDIVTVHLNIEKAIDGVVEKYIFEYTFDKESGTSSYVNMQKWNDSDGTGYYQVINENGPVPDGLFKGLK